MLLFVIPFLATLATTTIAHQCQNLTVPISTISLRATFNSAAPKSNIDVANLILNLTRPGFNYTASVLLNETVTTTLDHYNIHATYCEPDSGARDIVQILTHGLSFDRRYWNVPPLNGKSYSYVEQALARGYSTFAYDRLGAGETFQDKNNSAIDPVNDIQGWLEVSVLRSLTMIVRAGKLPVSGTPRPYAKVVHVGHSFGSGLTFGLTAQGGNVSDGIALTGFTKSTNFSVDFLRSGGFVNTKTLPSFSQYPDGYVASGTSTGLQLNFFAPGQFDPDMLDVAFRLSKPDTVGELLTKGAPAAGLSKFTNPVLIITGDRDIPYCGGNCSATSPSLVEATRAFWPNASKAFDTKLISSAGHGLNFELTAQSTYKTILDFFDDNVKNTSVANGYSNP